MDTSMEQMPLDLSTPWPDLDSSFCFVDSHYSASFSSQGPTTPISGRSTPGFDFGNDYVSSFSSLNSASMDFSSPQTAHSAYTHPDIDVKSEMPHNSYQANRTQFSHGLATPSVPVTPIKRHGLADDPSSEFGAMPQFRLNMHSPMLRDLSPLELGTRLDGTDCFGEDLQSLQTPNHSTDGASWESQLVSAMGSPISLDPMARWKGIDLTKTTGDDDSMHCLSNSSKARFDLEMAQTTNSIPQRRQHVDKTPTRRRTKRDSSTMLKDVRHAPSPTHSCVYPGCNKAFQRPEHLKRHVSSYVISPRVSIGSFAKISTENMKLQISTAANPVARRSPGDEITSRPTTFFTAEYQRRRPKHESRTARLRSNP